MLKQIPLSEGQNKSSDQKYDFTLRLPSLLSLSAKEIGVFSGELNAADVCL